MIPECLNLALLVCQYVWSAFQKMASMHKSQTWPHRSGGGGSMCLRNVSVLLCNYLVPYPRRLLSSAQTLFEQTWVKVWELPESSLWYIGDQLCLAAGYFVEKQHFPKWSELTYMLWWMKWGSGHKLRDSVIVISQWTPVFQHCVIKDGYHSSCISVTCISCLRSN
jgi:hypothetical protein